MAFTVLPNGYGLLWSSFVPTENPVLYLAWHRMRYETILFTSRVVFYSASSTIPNVWKAFRHTVLSFQTLCFSRSLFLSICHITPSTQLALYTRFLGRTRPLMSGIPARHTPLPNSCSIDLQGKKEPCTLCYLGETHR